MNPQDYYCAYEKGSLKYKTLIREGSVHMHFLLIIET